MHDEVKIYCSNCGKPKLVNISEAFNSPFVRWACGFCGYKNALTSEVVLRLSNYKGGDDAFKRKEMY